MPNQTCVSNLPSARPGNKTTTNGKTSASAKQEDTTSTAASQKPFYIRILSFQHGERFPILMPRDSGVPLLAPNVYLLSGPRMAGNQFGTLRSRAQAIKFLYEWCLKEAIDIEHRFQQKAFLTLSEVERLTADASLFEEELLAQIMTRQEPVTRTKVAKIERLRGKRAKGPPRVQSETVGIRLYYICSYLQWLMEKSLDNVTVDSRERLLLIATGQQMIRSIEARIPTEDSSSGEPKMGLDPKAKKVLLKVIDPLSEENPWRGANVRIRNRVLITLLLSTGMRIGEALGLRTADINLQKAELTIHRTPDDPLDPRLDKPQTKTNGRILALDQEMLQLLRDYILKQRRKSGPEAGRNVFLFLETKTGLPLSRNGAKRVFSTMKKKVETLSGISSHILRHTWNDFFSEMADEKRKAGVWTDEKEQRNRSYLQGWVPQSKMAETYSKRFIRREANEVEIKLQQKILEREEGK